MSRLVDGVDAAVAGSGTGVIGAGGVVFSFIVPIVHELLKKQLLIAGGALQQYIHPLPPDSCKDIPHIRILSSVNFE